MAQSCGGLLAVGLHSGWIPGHQKSHSFHTLSSPGQGGKRYRLSESCELVEEGEVRQDLVESHIHLVAGFHRQFDAACIGRLNESCQSHLHNFQKGPFDCRHFGLFGRSDPWDQIPHIYHSALAATEEQQ
jgi:hypothetical protein